jgi:subtilisin family serine protease
MPRRAFAAALLALACATSTAAYATPAQPATWNFAQIHIGRSQAAGHDGAGVIVAVADTWVDVSHPDFSGRIVGSADCTGGACKPGAAPPDGCEAHGTHVAGTVAARYYGVAPAARIMPLRVLRWDGSKCVGESADLAVAIRYAVAHGAKVVNVSAGAAVPLAGHDDRLDSAVAAAANAGVLVVFAAGNANLPIADSYGGNALIVAATGRDGAIASYSQHGTGVDLAAPGGDPSGDTCTESECVVSTWSQNGKHLYAALAGTSMAAPHVAGIAALLFAQRSRSRADVINRLRSTAHPLSGAGNGLVDASAALGVSAAAPSTKPATPPTNVVTPPRTTTAPRRTTSPTPKPITKPKPSSRPSGTPSPVTSGTATPDVVEPPRAGGGDGSGSRDAADRTVPVGVASLLLLATAGGTVALARKPQA